MNSRQILTITLYAKYLAAHPSRGPWALRTHVTRSAGHRGRRGSSAGVTLRGTCGVQDINGAASLVRNRSVQTLIESYRSVRIASTGGSDLPTGGG